jgi:hypothetical protein
VAVPDKNAKFASLDWSYPSGYPDGTYAVSLYWNGVHTNKDKVSGATVTTPHTVASAPVIDVGPWNQDDNWWNSYSDPLRHRRINDAGINGNGGLVGKPHLAFGLPEAQAAYFSHYGRPAVIPKHTTDPENYWYKPGAYDGQWAGADQFGRQVMNPAGIDIGHVPYAQLGLQDNEWVEVVPLWEARLGMNSTFKITSGPYLTGQVVTFSFNVRNLGTLPGTWEKAALRLMVNGVAVNPPDQGPFTLAPGASRTFTFTKELNSAGQMTATPMVRRAGI